MRRKLITVVAASALAACTALNPHLSFTPSPPLPTDTLAGNLDPALRDAYELSEIYYQAVGEQSLIRNGTALTLIPLGAAALGVGITSSGPATQRFLTGAGLGGAALYAGASFTVDSLRQLIWLKGSEALICAIKTVQPILMPKAEMPAFDERIARLGRAIFAAEAAFTPPIGPQEQTALSKAREILFAAQKWRAAILTSGQTLEGRIIMIRDKVSEQILRTEPDLNAVMAALGSSLRPIAGVIAPGAIPTGAPSKTGFTAAAGKHARLRAARTHQRCCTARRSTRRRLSDRERCPRGPGVPPLGHRRHPAIGIAIRCRKHCSGRVDDHGSQSPGRHRRRRTGRAPDQCQWLWRRGCNR
jgi:hypothetical protein